MGVRFRKSVKLAPGLRVNLSGSGMGLSVGPRGSSIGIGRRGTFLNVGLPGTGLSTRHQLSAGKSRAAAAKPAVSVVEAVAIGQDGTLQFMDGAGNPLSDAEITKAKKLQGDELRALVQQQCEDFNRSLQAMAEIHLDTNAPGEHVFDVFPFEKSYPIQPIPKHPGVLCRLFKFCVARIEAENLAAEERYAAAVTQWKNDKAEHDAREKTLAALVHDLNAGNPTAIEQHFEGVLQQIEWPKETMVSFDLVTPTAMVIDVDLPEIEDMPDKTASVPQRGINLSLKEIGTTQKQKLYMQHVHAVGFRLAGEAFAASPKINYVTISAYSQRVDKGTGQITDQYLYSAKIQRSVWEAIDFKNLANLDVVEAFTRFELRREMSKTGVFKAITPWVLSAQETSS